MANGTVAVYFDGDDEGIGRGKDTTEGPFQ